MAAKLEFKFNVLFTGLEAFLALLEKDSKMKICTRLTFEIASLLHYKSHVVDVDTSIIRL